MNILKNSKIIDARIFSKSAKLTCQRSGKLGFSTEAANLFSLKDNIEKRLLLYDIGSNNLAAIITEEANEEGFKILKGGEYFYVRLKNFLDSRSIPYKEKRVIYDISDSGEELEGKTIYKLTQRIREFSNDETDVENE